MFPSECLALLTLQDLYGLLRPGQQHGGQGSGEDEACSVGAHCVHQGAGAGDVAAHAAKCLAWKQNPQQVREAHMKPIRALWEVSLYWWVLCIPSVPEMMSILCMTLSLSPMPPPLGPYKPTAWTSSTKVMAPNLWAMSHISSSGHTAPEGSTVVSWSFKPTYFYKNLFKYCMFTFICALPSIECTVSKATIFGVEGSDFSSSSLRWLTSLWRKINFLTPLFLIPWIIEAWLPASE